MRLWKNKLVAIILVLMGYVMYLIDFDNDATILLLFVMIAIPMFFAKQDCFAFIDDERGQ